MAFNAANGAFPQGLGCGTDASGTMAQSEQEEIAKTICFEPPAGSVEWPVSRRQFRPFVRQDCEWSQVQD